jgi:hypothetical protein
LFTSPVTEVVLNKIVALAKAGEHDAGRLAELVLNESVDDPQATFGEATDCKRKDYNSRRCLSSLCLDP